MSAIGTGVEGNYQVLVTIHSLVLLESRCAECYKFGNPVQHGLCCEEANINTSSCPNTCDILLRFCQLNDITQFNFTDALVGSRECWQPSPFRHADDLLGFDFEAGVIYCFEEVGLIRGLFRLLSNPVTYNEIGRWVSLVTI